MAAIATLNNEAVMLLVAGDNGRAMRTLCRASALHSPKKNGACEEEVQAPSIAYPPLCGLSQWSLLRTPISACEKYGVSPHNDFCFYARALQLDDGHFDYPKNDNLLSMVLLFNMAITYHQRGLMPSSVTSSSASNLTKALSIYDTIVNMVRAPDSANSDPVYNVNLKIVTLAAFSNMAHVYSHFCMSREAGMCRSHLEALLLESPDPRGFLDREESVVFHLNITFYGNKGAAAA